MDEWFIGLQKVTISSILDASPEYRLGTSDKCDRDKTACTS